MGTTIDCKLIALLLCMLLVGATARSLNSNDALDHQRILAELEEVHQLRERMLQEGQWTN